jgi:hypothetical protein
MQRVVRRQRCKTCANQRGRANFPDCRHPAADPIKLMGLVIESPLLLRKLKYLEDSGAVQTTEQFIELAASSSSTTGQLYLVKCGSGAAVRSGAWLRSQLQVLRSAERARSAP